MKELILKESESSVEFIQNCQLISNWQNPTLGLWSFLFWYYGVVL
jgi:hypothetical protein